MIDKRSLLPLLILSVSAGACDGDAENEEDPVPAWFQEDGLFAPDSFGTNEDYVDPEVESDGANELVTLELSGGGELRFVDERPSSDEPAISVVAVLPPGQQDVDYLISQNASALEMFLALSPDGDEPPEALVRDHAARYKDLQVPESPRRLDIPEDGDRAIGAPRTPTSSDPTVEDDDWGTNSSGHGCADASGFNSGFHQWHGFLTDGHYESNTYRDPPAGPDTYGYFGTMDKIWAGVCMHRYACNPGTVSIQRWDGSNYVTISGTLDSVPRYDRYLYYNYTPNSAARRVAVKNWDGVGNCTSDRFLLSGAWAEPYEGG